MYNCTPAYATRHAHTRTTNNSSNLLSCNAGKSWIRQLIITERLGLHVAKSTDPLDSSETYCPVDEERREPTVQEGRKRTGQSKYNRAKKVKDEC